MINILILGPQGSGKGTQAEILAQKFNLYYFEAGDFLRKVAETDENIHEQLNKGILLEDNVVFGLVSNFLEKQKIYSNILFDGYPRSIKQFELINKWLGSKEREIDIAIFLNIPESESIKRLSARRMDPQTGKIYNLITNPPGEDVNINTLIHREDDTPDAIKVRLQKYHESTSPLLDLLKSKNLLFEVDGLQKIEDIQKQIVKIIERKINVKN